MWGLLEEKDRQALSSSNRKQSRHFQRNRVIEMSFSPHNLVHDYALSLDQAGAYMRTVLTTKPRRRLYSIYESKEAHSNETQEASATT